MFGKALIPHMLAGQDCVHVHVQTVDIFSQSVSQSVSQSAYVLRQHPLPRALSVQDCLHACPENIFSLSVDLHACLVSPFPHARSVQAYVFVSAKTVNMFSQSVPSPMRALCPDLFSFLLRLSACRAHILSEALLPRTLAGQDCLCGYI
eukprot:871313-Pelagomonas_calceolata.AAC.1